MNYIVFNGSKDPSCAKCRFRNGEICVITGEKRLYQICPIRTLPEKKEVNLELDYEAYYQIGWNECLEELEK